jgi:hypothetical protein
MLPWKLADMNPLKRGVHCPNGMGAAKPGVMPPGAAPTRGESGDKVSA